MEQFDVIVVGGSVSGAPTATHLARKGYKVLMVEKDTFPRDTNSTHFIWPRGMSYLNRLGVADKILAQTPSFKKLEVSIEGISLHGGVPLQAVKDRFVKLHGAGAARTRRAVCAALLRAFAHPGRVPDGAGHVRVCGPGALPFRR